MEGLKKLRKAIGLVIGSFGVGLGLYGGYLILIGNDNKSSDLISDKSLAPVTAQSSLISELKEDLGNEIGAEKSPLEETVLSDLDDGAIVGTDSAVKNDDEIRYRLWNNIGEYLANASKMGVYDEVGMTHVTRSVTDEISALDRIDCEYIYETDGILTADSTFVLPGFPGRVDLDYMSSISNSQRTYTIQFWSEDERVVSSFSHRFSPKDRPYVSLKLHSHSNYNELENADITIETGIFRFGEPAPIRTTTYNLLYEDPSFYSARPLLENLGLVLEQKIRAGQR